MLLHFSLQNLLRTTAACSSSTSQLPKLVREWCVLTLFTSTCASRQNSVHFFISHLASWLRTRGFSNPTFRPSRATNHWKNQLFRDYSQLSYLFTHLYLLSSDFLTVGSSPPPVFSLPTFSMPELLPGCAFPSVHTVGNLLLHFLQLLYLDLYVCIYACMRACMCLCVNVCVCVCLQFYEKYVCTHTHIYIYVHSIVCICMRRYVCILCNAT